jgi:hypothetical protein
VPNLAGVLVDNAGVLQCSVGGAIVGYSGGWPPWPLGADGTVLCAMEASQARVFAGGFAFDSSGYLIVAQGGTPAGYIGGIGVTANGAMCVDTAGSTAGYTAGVALTASSLIRGAGLFNPHTYLMEAFSTRPGAPAWTSASGSYTANSGQVLTNARTASAYCMGDDGFLHLLGGGTIRVEPKDWAGAGTGGLVSEGTAANYIFPTSMASFGAGGVPQLSPFGANITATPNNFDVASPDYPGNSPVGKLVFGTRLSTEQDWVYALTGSGVNSYGSIYIRSAPGFGTQTIGLHRCDAVGVNGSLNFSVPETWTRIGAASAGYLALGYGNDSGDSWPSTAGATFYIWGPQVEVTGLATASLRFGSSHIPTTSAAATRDGDYIQWFDAGFGQPGTFRASCTATPATGATWQGIAGWNGIGVMMAIGPNGTANNARLSCVSATDGQWDVTDATNQVALTLPGAFSGSSKASFGGVDTAGTLTGNPGGGSLSGIGTGVFSAAPTTPFVLGSPSQGLTNFRHYGWMRDCVIDNK